MTTTLDVCADSFGPLVDSGSRARRAVASVRLVKVEDPEGQVWRVSRRWVPWRRRLRDVASFDVGTLPSSLPDDAAGLVIAGVLVVAVVLVPFVLIGVVFVLELLLVLLLLPLAVVARALVGRAWSVETRRGWRVWAEVTAGDWQQSGLMIHTLADDIRRGHPPVRTVGVEQETGI